MTILPDWKMGNAAGVLKDEGTITACHSGDPPSILIVGPHYSYMYVHFRFSCLLRVVIRLGFVLEVAMPIDFQFICLTPLPRTKPTDP